MLKQPRKKLSNLWALQLLLTATNVNIRITTIEIVGAGQNQKLKCADIEHMEIKTILYMQSIMESAFNWKDHSLTTVKSKNLSAKL